MTIRARRGTTAERLAIIPLDGELAWDSQTKKLYVGDGVTAGGVSGEAVDWTVDQGSTNIHFNNLTGVDPAGTDNSTNVTLAGTYNYLTLSGQQITLGQIDLSTDVTGSLPYASLSGTPTIPTALTDLDTTVTGAQLNALKTKVDAVESGATADQTDSEIETAYNNQVAQISAAEITAGTETGIRRLSPANLKSFVDTHGGSGGGGAGELSDLSDVSTSTPTDKFALVANGTSFVSRALTKADVSDFSEGDYATAAQGAKADTALQSVSSGDVTAHEGDINHDNLSGFVANEHIDWTVDQGATNIAFANLTGVDAAGTDNSTDVTLAGAYNYLTIAGQVITLGQIDLATDVTGLLPYASLSGAPTIPDELVDLDTTVTGAQLNALKTKVDGIETGATADQTDAEIETAYNNQVAQVSAGEITAGTETGVRRVSPADIKSFIDTHASGGGSNSLSTTNFNNNLSSSEDTVQKAMDKLDDLPMVNTPYVTTDVSSISVPDTGGTFTLNGYNLDTVTALSASGCTITITSSNYLTIEASVASGATGGTKDLTLTYGGGTVVESGFTIAAPTVQNAGSTGYPWQNETGDIATGESFIEDTAVGGFGWVKGASFGSIPANTNFTLSVEIHPDTTSSHSVHFGVSTSDTNTNFSSIAHAFNLYQGNVRIYEGSTQRGGNHTTFVNGDVLKIIRTNGVITFQKNNDAAMYTSSASETGSLVGDFSMNQNTKLTNISITHD